MGRKERLLQIVLVGSSVVVGASFQASNPVRQGVRSLLEAGRIAAGRRRSEETTELLGLYYNPCTGEWSNDQFEPDASCTPSAAPSSMPSVQTRKEPVTNISCAFGATGDVLQANATTFFYSVEAVNTTEPDIYLPTLEETLLSAVADKLLACGTERRGLQDMPNMRSRRSLTIRRRLELVGISSLPVDREYTPGSCDPELDESNNCNIFEGGMTVTTDEPDDNFTQALLVAVEEVMQSGALVTSDVKKVRYLGVGPPSPPNAVVVGSRGFGSTQSDSEPAGVNWLGIMVVPIIVASIILLLLALFLQKRRQTKYSVRRLQEVNAERGLGSDDDGEDANVPDSFVRDVEIGDDSILGAGAAPKSYTNGATKAKALVEEDSPGSFHLGRFHYTQDGVQYLSANCKACRQTSMLGKDPHRLGAVGLPTIMEDAEANNNLCRQAAPRGPAAPNVHRCKSATCEVCQPGGGSPETTFETARAGHNEGDVAGGGANNIHRIALKYTRDLSPTRDGTRQPFEETVRLPNLSSLSSDNTTGSDEASI